MEGISENYVHVLAVVDERWRTGERLLALGKQLRKKKLRNIERCFLKNSRMCVFIVKMQNICNLIVETACISTAINDKMLAVISIYGFVIYILSD